MDVVNLLELSYFTLTYYSEKVNIKMHKALIFLLFP